MITFFLFVGFLPSAQSLVPLEGLLYGNVADIKQYDPFVGMLNSNYTPLDQKEGKEKAKLTRYLALYQQGMELVNHCEATERAEYSNKNSEDSALRSTLANMQYIGLDYTIRNIVNYAKLLEYDENSFTNLYENLISNSCSQNITIFSHKMMKVNFKHFWKNGTELDPPSLGDSPYFSASVKEKLNSRETMNKAFMYTLNSFRSLCSWSGSTDHFGLLAPYVKNPFLMSNVFNNMLQRKIDIDEKTQRIFYNKAENSIQVSCENLVCRRRTSIDFIRFFPKINGSSNLEDDLKLLYCNYFQNARTKKEDLAPEQKKWIEGIERNQRLLEAQNLLGQITGFPDLTLGMEK